MRIFNITNSAQGFLASSRGNKAFAKGMQAEAIGDGAIANGAKAYAKGEEASAHGKYSTAIGPLSNADGPFSRAEGTLANAVGTWAEAKGDAASARGWGATSVGDFSIAEGKGATAIDGGQAMTEGSYAKGTGAIVSENYPAYSKAVSSKYANEGEFPKECAICIEGIDPHSLAPETKCGHTFHKLCLMKWIAIQKANPSCPNCREEELLDPKLLQAIKESNPYEAF